MDALGLLSDDDGDASDDAKEEEQDTTACEHDAKRQKVGIVDFAALQRAGYSEGADEGEEQAASDSFKKTFSALQDAVKDDLPGRQKLGTEVPGLETTYEIMTEGDPVRTVAKGCKVIVHATGVIKKTGRVFWSTKEVDKGEPHLFLAGAGKKIAGWEHGCLGMRVGEIRKLHIPGHEGYGAAGLSSWGILPHAALEFTIEVLDIAAAD
eukprot:TRINITY_DN16812_c0_g1_i2.p1 TRINITY_DN16812_c0_g1~~TRINITY_DN16812_c0_g1_i2.p1  ORF type:complete len:226 (-),score=61.37 TRINITY_DN16812_c0_g1_i2:393-1019(-)